MIMGKYLFTTIILPYCNSISIVNTNFSVDMANLLANSCLTPYISYLIHNFLQPLCPPHDQYFPEKSVGSTLIHVISCINYKLICPLVEYQCTAGSRGASKMKAKNGCPPSRICRLSLVFLKKLQ